MIHINDQSQIYSWKYSWIWLLSAFKSGFINSAGFLATGKFVSHVTGFGTQVGISVGHDDFLFGAELLVIPVSFVLGGMVTSVILDRNYQKGETPSYFLVQGLITILIGVVILLGERDFTSHNVMEFVVIGLLCLVCGLKNALVTWTTKGKIRVTHLTGISTDLGLNLIRTFMPRQPSPQFQEKRIVNVHRFLTIAAFSSGAFISALMFPRFGYNGFLLVFVISILMTAVSIYDWKKHARAEEARGFESLSSANELMREW